ncbi:hypothetical protein [Micromonospora sp. NPDC049033]|uniref:hypothetical protein n=1 Tax=Micromonospora sp. NPDC049033 TaxID=3155149 RepID=UPI0033D8DF2B
MDRYTLIPDTTLDQAHAGLTEPARWMRRTHLAEQAWRAWQDDPERSLEQHQRAVIAAEVDSYIESVTRNAAGRARLAAAPEPEPNPGGGDQLAHADQLDARGDHFTAARIRRDVAHADHAARRRRVEQQVASDERLHKTLRNRFGAAYADEFMGGDAA